MTACAVTLIQGHMRCFQTKVTLTKKCTKEAGNEHPRLWDQNWAKAHEDCPDFKDLPAERGQLLVWK